MRIYAYPIHIAGKVREIFESLPAQLEFLHRDSQRGPNLRFERTSALLPVALLMPDY